MRVHLVSNFFFHHFSNRKSDSGLLEWGIVELQGDLEVRGDEFMDNQFIGDLNYDKYGQPVNIFNSSFEESLFHAKIDGKNHAGLVYIFR